MIGFIIERIIGFLNIRYLDFKELCGIGINIFVLYNLNSFSANIESFSNI
jgi:hypothetical protein